VNFDNIIGKRLRDERKRLGWSQQFAATTVGVSREMWAKYEGGAEPGAKALARMLSAGVDVLYVLTGQRGTASRETLSTNERTLLDNYRHSSQKQKQFIEEAAVMSWELQLAKTGT